MHDALPGYARIALVIGYHTGGRKGEIRQIRIDKIDFRGEQPKTKNRDTYQFMVTWEPMGDSLGSGLRGCRCRRNSARFGARHRARR